MAFPSARHVLEHTLFSKSVESPGLPLQAFIHRKSATLRPSPVPPRRWSLTKVPGTTPRDSLSAISQSTGGRDRRLSVVAQAASGSSSADGRKESRWDPLLANSDVGCPVPPEQQPVNEYSDLAEAFFFSWATAGPFNLGVRLAAVGTFSTVALGFPIASASFDVETQALQCVLSAIAGGLFPVIFVTARLYLGWQYIGARLSSATVEYEETGWYDGQTWVKTPELLARDRLLASYRVKPVLTRLQRTLVGLGASLGIIICLVALLPDYKPKPEARQMFFNDFEVENRYLVNIIRAEEKFEEEEDLLEDVEGEGEGGSYVGASASVAMMYMRLHSAPALDVVPVS